MRRIVLRAALLGIVLVLPARAEEILRRPSTGFPIASSVTVPGGSRLVFLVGDPRKNGAMDFEGLMEAYTRHFGTEAQKNLPARTTVQVAGLPLPGALVEIEVIAAHP